MSIPIQWIIIMPAEERIGVISANDAPLPIPISQSIPPLVGDEWPEGTIFTFTFGPLAPQDSALLAALTSGTLTVYVTLSGWRRVNVTFSYTAPTLTATTTGLNIIQSWVTPI